MAIIFQNKQIKKKDFYAWFIQEWKNQGWIDISSATADGQMLYSKGIEGNKDLFINFRENSSEGVFSTTAGRMIDLRFPKWYTPNQTPNTAGVLERPSATWWRMSLITTTAVGLDSTMSVWYYINENYGVFLIEGHNGYNNASNFLFVGNPKELKPEVSNSAVIFMSTNGYPMANSVAYCVDDPYSIKTSDMQLTIYDTIPPRPKSTFDKKFCSDIVIGNADGFRFQIDDGILITGATNVISTNTFMINGYKYRFFKTNVSHTSWGNSLLDCNVGIRIE